MARYELQRKVKIGWSQNFAYAIGLIASDGWLSSNKRHIGFASKEVELVENLKSALALTNRISRSGRGGETVKKYFKIEFGDKAFYRFLNRIGITPAKSKTIESVRVPDKFFADFLRGLFDGDGTFYSFWDKRWQKSFCFKLSFASASLNFLNWLKTKLSQLYWVKGYIHKGDGVFNLEYVKGDSKRLFNVMYHEENILRLGRKYDKMKNALEQDGVFGFPYLQKHQNAAVTQG